MFTIARLRNSVRLMSSNSWRHRCSTTKANELKTTVRTVIRPEKVADKYIDQPGWKELVLFIAGSQEDKLRSIATRDLSHVLSEIGCLLSEKTVVKERTNCKGSRARGLNGAISLKISSSSAVALLEYSDSRDTHNNNIFQRYGDQARVLNIRVVPLDLSNNCLQGYMYTDNVNGTIFQSAPKNCRCCDTLLRWKSWTTENIISFLRT